MKKERDSGIELLRIIAMLMVIIVHLLLYGKYNDAIVNIDGIVQSSGLALRIFVRSAVNIFLIISGFFMVRSKFDLKKSYSRVLRIYISIFFYSIVLSIIAICVGAQTREAMGIQLSDAVIAAKMFFPISSQIWYFLTDYIFVMLLAPFVNLALTSITKKQYQVLLIVSGFIMSLWLFIENIRVLSPIASAFGHEGMYSGKNVFSFLFMYIIGGYIGLHIKSNPRPQVRFLALTVIAWLANYFIYTRLDEKIGYQGAVYAYANPFVIAVAVFMFMFFKDLHFKSKIINVLGGTTLGVYAISEFWLVRAWLWGIFDFTKLDCTNIFKNIAMIFGVTVLIFISCAIIELIRQKLFNGVETVVKSFRKTE